MSDLEQIGFIQRPHGRYRLQCSEPGCGAVIDVADADVRTMVRMVRNADWNCGVASQPLCAKHYAPVKAKFTPVTIPPQP